MGGWADMASPTAYQLFIEVAVPLRLTVGRLGCFDFPAGEYVYTGSARRNLEARIAHFILSHVERLSGEKALKIKMENPIHLAQTVRIVKPSLRRSQMIIGVKRAAVNFHVS